MHLASGQAVAAGACVQCVCLPKQCSVPACPACAQQQQLLLNGACCHDTETLDGSCLASSCGDSLPPAPPVLVAGDTLDLPVAPSGLPPALPSALPSAGSRPPPLLPRGPDPDASRPEGDVLSIAKPNASVSLALGLTLTPGEAISCSAWQGKGRGAARRQQGAR